MLSFLSDENFNGDVVRGLFLLQPNLDLIRVQATNLQGADDPTILDWAANNDRILLTHDRATMPDFAYQRLVRGERMAGLFVINDRMSIRQAIDELSLINDCTKQEEWRGIVLYLPL
jgi:predicted nuclease of predicted toxin-antitoxin system